MVSGQTQFRIAATTIGVVIALIIYYTSIKSKTSQYWEYTKDGRLIEKKIIDIFFYMYTINMAGNTGFIYSINNFLYFINNNINTFYVYMYRWNMGF